MKRCLIAKLLGAPVLAVVVAGGAYGFGSIAVHPQVLAKNVFVVEVMTAPAVASAPAPQPAP